MNTDFRLRRKITVMLIMGILSATAYSTKSTAQNFQQMIKLIENDRSNQSPAGRAPSDNFGYSVAISGDYAIVGSHGEDEDASGFNTASNAGGAYIFMRNGSSWTFQQKIVASDGAAGDNFGYSVSISGDYALVGAYQEDQDASGGNTASKQQPGSESGREATQL